MARYDHLPIWKTAMDLAVLSRQSEQLCCRSRRGYSLRVLERAVRGFPRYHKYALGADLRRQAQRICALIVRANEARAERERALEQLVCAVDERKTLIQLGKAIQAFSNFNEFVQAAEYAVSLGRQSGGWRRRVRPEASPQLGGFVGGALAPIFVGDAIAAEAAPTGARPQASRTKGEKPARPGFAASVEIPAKALPRLRRKMKAAGIPHVAVAETGYLKSGHKRRELVYSWAPPGAFPSFHPVVR